MSIFLGGKKKRQTKASVVPGTFRTRREHPVTVHDREHPLILQGREHPVVAQTGAF